MLERFDHYPRQLKRAAENGLLGNCPSRPYSKLDWATFFFVGMQKMFSFQPDAIRKIFYDVHELPFNPREYSFAGKIGEGAINDVYLIASKTGGLSWVLKVNNLAHGENGKLVKEAAATKREYETIKATYGKISNFILPEYHLVISGPRKAEISAVTLQPFQGYDVRDIFQPNGEINITPNPVIQQKIGEFIDITRENWMPPGPVVDILGKNNLVITNKQQLVLLDPHPTTIEADNDEKAWRFNQRLNKLENCLS